MKRRIISLLALVLVCVMALASCGGATKLTMGTGGTGGTYNLFGGVISQYIKNGANVDCVAVSTDGSKANILGISDGDYQLGTVQSDVMAYAWAGTNAFAESGAVKNFRVIGGLYAEAVQLITTNPSIQSVSDLAGKKVSIGAPNSGVYFNAIDVLSAVGLTENDIDAQYQDFNSSAESLQDGQIDAAFIVAGAPTIAVTELMKKNSNARLVPIDGAVADAIMAACPYYAEYTIPAGTYSTQTEAISTITVKATLIVSADLDENTVYNITKSIFDNATAIAVEHAKGHELSLENATSGMTAPFHKGAAKYFAEKGITVTTE